MSVSAINWAIEMPGTPTQKHVLLVLANHANDEGDAFPSTERLCHATGLSNRAVRQARNDLIAAGLLEKSSKYTRNGVRLMMAPPAAQVAADAAKPAARSANAANPATSGKVAPPATKAAPPAAQVAADAAPHNHHLTTTNHHSIPPNPPAQKSAQKFELPDWVPVEPWQGWLEMRRSKKCPPTPRALVLAVRDLADLRDAGHAPGAVLDQSTQRGWRGLFPVKGGNIVPFVPQPEAPKRRPSSNPFEGFADGFDDEIPEMTPAEKAAWKRFGGQP